jgi:hypothetical protein
VSQTLCRMDVLPAFALPIISTRNWMFGIRRRVVGCPLERRICLVDCWLPIESTVNHFTDDGLRFYAPFAADVTQPPVGQQRRRRMRHRENVNAKVMNLNMSNHRLSRISLWNMRRLCVTLSRCSVRVELAPSPRAAISASALQGTLENV